MKSQKKNIICFACICLSLTSCASYKASPLSDPSINTQEAISGAMQKDQETFVVSRAFTKEDCKKFLDRDVLAEGYQPIQIFIQNNSPKTYQFSTDRISLPIARAEEVAEKVHTSTVGRAVGYGVGALFLWPLAIPAIIDGMGSAKANDSLDNDFASKAARDGLILPYSKFNAIAFVPRNAYHSSYTLTLIDMTTKKPKNFDVIVNN